MKGVIDMDQDKLLETTNKLIRNQNEINTVLQDLRNEVIKARNLNKNLAIENNNLRNRIKDLEANKPQVLAQTPQVEPEIEVKEEPVKPIFKEPVVENKTPSLATYKKEERVYKDSSINKSAIYEFFLGKNVIAKIAAVLISLGIFTFGRITYNWLDDAGRVFFILLIGLGFFIIGYLFDRKENDVFQTIFYSVGLTSITISLYLSYFTYELIYAEMFYALSTFLTLMIFIYFRKKKQTFMDFVLLILYSVISVFMIVDIQNPSAFEMVLFILQSIVIGGIYLYNIFFKYKDDMQKILLPLIIGMTTLSLVSTFTGVFDSEPINVVYSFVLIIILYVMNYKTVHYKPLVTTFVILLTIFINLVSMVLIVEEILSVNEIYMYFLLNAIVLIPLYIYLYKDKVDHLVHNYDIYAFMITVFILLFVFTYNIGYTSDIAIRVSNLISRNIILLIVTAIYYVVAKFSKRSTHLNMFYAVIIINIIYMFSTALNYGVRIELLGYYLPNALFFIILVISNQVLSKLNKLDNIQYRYLLNIVAALAFVLFPLVFIHDNRAAFDSQYIKILYAAIIYLLVAYKHLIRIPFFTQKQMNHLNFVLNLFIIGWLFFTNIINFNHDFTNGIHVLTFFAVLVPNIYIVYVIKEVYFYLKGRIQLSDEWLFIALYKLGVLLQTLFVIYYINFTYDKVFLSSYWMIAAAVGVLLGFRFHFKTARYIGLAAIYFSLIKFFVYDFFNQNLSDTVQVVTYTTLGLILLGISFLYSHLEKVYGGNEVLPQKNPAD